MKNLKDIIKAVLTENQEEINRKIKELEILNGKEINFKIELDEYDSKNNMIQATYYFSKEKDDFFDADEFLLKIDNEKFYEHYLDISKDLISYKIKECNLELDDQFGNTHLAKNIQEYISLRYNFDKDEKILNLK